MATIAVLGPSGEVVVRVVTASTAAAALTTGANRLDAGAQRDWELAEADVVVRADGAMARPEGQPLDPAKLSRDVASRATKIWIMWQLEAAAN